VTSDPWTADIDIDAALVANLVGAQFPELAGKSVAPFGVGWDNAAFLVDGRILFRFPRRRIATRLIAREVALLPHIESALPLPISAPHFAGKPSAEYPWTFAGYAMIRGTSACSVSLPEDRRAALARPLGEFLRALHAIDAAPLVELGLPPDEIGRLDPRKRIAATRERLPRLAAANAVARPEALLEWLEAHPPQPLDDGKRRIVHGDLYARHVLLDARGTPAGVIDWGDMHLGDPALDLAIAHLMLPAGAHAAFREAYGPIDERTWSAARFRAVYHAIVELDYGIRENDAGMRDAGARALQLLYL
jgi:aminoglycoside phosphotransferase (APT) family kinase protein